MTTWSEILRRFRSLTASIPTSASDILNDSTVAGTDVQDALNRLKAASGKLNKFAISTNTSVNFNTAAEVAVPWDRSPEFEQGSFSHDPAQDTRLTCTEDSKVWLILVQLAFDTARARINLAGTVRKNGTVDIGSRGREGLTRNLSVMAMTEMQSGDYIEVVCSRQTAVIAPARLGAGESLLVGLEL